MQQPERHLVVEFMHGAFGALLLPFRWIASVPAALLRRARRSAGESAQLALHASIDTRRWSLGLLKRIEWRRFEELAAAYFDAAGAARATMLVHCRTWNAEVVGIPPLRELSAAMAAAPLAAGAFVTSGKFTREAHEFAAKERIELIDGAGLLAKIAALAPERAAALLELATEGAFLTPTCPACSIKMVARQSTGEGRKYWGCAKYPRCKHTFFSSANAPG